MKTLLVYYSRTGTTRTLAGDLARALGADVEEIRCGRYGAGPFGFVRAAYDSLRGRLPPIEPLSRTPTGYGLVIVGGPIWTSHAATPVRAWLRQEASRLPPAAFFLTHGGSPPDDAFGEMARTAGAPPLATLAVRQADVRNGRHRQAVASFAATLRGRAAA